MPYRNKEKALECSRRCSKEYSRTKRGRFNNVRRHAKARGIIFDLSFEDWCALSGRPCTYCGGPLPETSGGIDRRENIKGYTIENSVPCCQQCNRAKHVMSDIDFCNWIKRVFLWRGI